MARTAPEFASSFESSPWNGNCHTPRRYPTRDLMATLSDYSGIERTSHARMHENGAAAGEMLRRARERRGLTLDQLSHETKIARRDLEALEHDHLAVGAGDFYGRAKLRAYARAVKLDQNLVLPEDSRGKSTPSRVREPPPKRTRMVATAIVTMSAALFALSMGGGAPRLENDARIRAT